MEKGMKIDLPSKIVMDRSFQFLDFENYFHIYFSPPVVYNMRMIFNSASDLTS